MESGSDSDSVDFIKISENILARMLGSVVFRRDVKSPGIAAVKEYIRENFLSLPSVDELACMACLSPFYFTKLFKEEVGLSPHAYINQLRVNKAKEMMAKRVPLLQIAHELGFTDQSHFSKTFLKVTGVTPTCYGLATER